MYMYIYIYIYIQHIYTYIFTYIQTYMHTYIRINKYIYPLILPARLQAADRFEAHLLLEAALVFITHHFAEVRCRAKRGHLESF